MATTQIDTDQIRSIDWSRVNKAASSLADLITRDAGDLSSGTIPAARLTGRSLADLGTRDANDLTGTLAAARLTGRSLADLGTRSAGDLSSGTLLDARLSANVALLTALNVFTANQRINAGLGVNVAPPATGAIALSGSLFELGRAVAQGFGTNVAYVSTTFTANTGTWGVDAGDQIIYRYILIGNLMYLAFTVDTSSVSGGQPHLRLAIPAAKLAAVDLDGSCYANNAGAGFLNTCAVLVRTGLAYLILQPAPLGVGTWSASTNTTAVRGGIWFEVQP